MDRGGHHADWRAGLVSHGEHHPRRLRDLLPLLDSPVGDDAETALTAISAAGLTVGC